MTMKQEIKKTMKFNNNEINFEKEIYFVSQDYKYANNANEKHYFKTKNELINYLAQCVDDINHRNKGKKYFKEQHLQHRNFTLTSNIQRRQLNIIAKYVYFHHNTHFFGW